MTKTIQESMVELLDAKTYPIAVSSILHIISERGIDPVAIFQFRQQKGIGNIELFKEDNLDVILDYAEHCLEDDILSEYEVSCIQDLQRLFHIEAEDFARYKKTERVNAILISQLEKLYEDNRIDASEVMKKGQLQSVFGLGYDDFEELAHQCAKRAIERGANPDELDIFDAY